MENEGVSTGAMSILYEEARQVMRDMGLETGAPADVHEVFENYRRVIKTILEKKTIPADSPDAKTLKEMQHFFKNLHQKLRTVVELEPITE